jgi:hypothetical protein
MEHQHLPVKRGSWRRFFQRLFRPFRRRAQTFIRNTIVEQSRYQVSLGDEVRMVDNSQSSSSTTRKARLTREWTKSWTVDAERTTMTRGSADLGLHIVDLRAMAERTLREAYSFTAEERETFEEEVTLRIAPHTTSRIVFSWQEIRQKGIVRTETDDFEARIPYEIVVGLTFDQQQVDIPSRPAISEISHNDPGAK